MACDSAGRLLSFDMYACFFYGLQLRARTLTCRVMTCRCMPMSGICMLAYAESVHWLGSSGDGTHPGRHVTTTGQAKRKASRCAVPNPSQSNEAHRRSFNCGNKLTWSWGRFLIRNGDATPRQERPLGPAPISGLEHALLLVIPPIMVGQCSVTRLARRSGLPSQAHVYYRRGLIERSAVQALRHLERRRPGG